MTTFRVHFDVGEPLDIDTDTPKQAEAQAKAVRPGIIRKIKRVKEQVDG